MRELNQSKESRHLTLTVGKGTFGYLSILLLGP